jgi:probable phosphoglycerate mutase
MRLYVIRHASADYKRNGLTERGIAESHALAQRMESEGIRRIFSSPEGRALATAQMSADLLGQPVTVESWIQELDLLLTHSDSQQRLLQNLPGAEVRSNGPCPTLTDWYTYPPFVGTPALEYFKRIVDGSDRFLGSLGYVRNNQTYAVVEPNHLRVALFCHHGSALAWLAHLLAIPPSSMWAGFHLSPSSVTVVWFANSETGITTPRCLALGDTSHLYSIPEFRFKFALPSWETSE